MLYRSPFWSWFRPSTPFLKTIAITCVICSTFMMCGSARHIVTFLTHCLDKGTAEERRGIEQISKEDSWLGTLPCIVNPIGFILGGYIMDAFGRKYSVVAALFPFVAGWGIIFQARRLSHLYVAGIIHGIASGMAMTASPYISEIAPQQYRGFFLSLLPISYNLGPVICTALVGILGWVQGAACLLILSGIAWLLAFLIPESPYWLVLQGRTSDATQVLQLIRADDVVEEEMLDIKKCAPGRRSSHVFSVQAPTQPPRSGTVAALWRVRRQIAMLATLSILHKFTGFTALSMYIKQFFAQLYHPLQLEDSLADTLTFVHTAVCFASCFAVPFFAQNFGKRPLLAATSALAGLSMAAALLAKLEHLWRPSRSVALAGVYGYDVFINVGLTSVLVMLPAELLPAEISGIACALFNVLGSVFTSVAVRAYFPLFAAIGLRCMLATFVGCCFAVALFAVTVLPETRGKTLAQIQETYFRAEVAAADSHCSSIGENKAASQSTSSDTAVLPV